MAHDVFICHSSSDSALANAICSTLEQHRIRCWMAPRDVLPGSDYAESILSAISGSRLALLVFSANSNRSAHVHREIERCVGHGIPILPFRVADVVPSPALEYFISNAHWLDAVTPPLERHLQHLVGTVQLLLERETAGTTAATLPPPTAATRAPEVTPSRAHGPPPLSAPPRRSHVAGWIAAGVAVIAVIALVVAGLSGSGGEQSTSPSRSSAVTQPDATEPATTGPVTTSPPGTALRGPTQALDSFTFTQTMSFSWEGTVVDVQAWGAFVAPESRSCVMEMQMSGMTFRSEAIVIGDRAWFDDGYGAGLLESEPDDPSLRSTLSGCPSSDDMWGDEVAQVPAGGEDITRNGLELTSFDVTGVAGSFGELFGLPPGMTAEEMVMRVSRDRSWLAGMDATFTGSAETFRAFMGVPPEGVTSDCRFTMAMDIERPNDPSISITPPTAP